MLQEVKFPYIAWDGTTPGGGDNPTGRHRVVRTDKDNIKVEQYIGLDAMGQEKWIPADRQMETALKKALIAVLSANEKGVSE